MPRLTNQLLRRARAIDPLLPLLLRPCRELRDAQNELRWLREFAQGRSASPTTQQIDLRRLCVQRSTGKPLQYILGNQPFGELDIQCRPGVLVPRPETESYTTFLARYLQTLPRLQEQQELRILDLCTGTGCISLLLHSLLAGMYTKLEIRGVDISETALRLARHNLKLNVQQGNLDSRALAEVQFCQGDVLSDAPVQKHKKWDIVVSNPPYISRTSFHKDTTRSARIFEPKLALVPQHRYVEGSGKTDITGDVFYPRIIDIAQRAEAKLVVMEVADAAQAHRVLAEARGSLPAKMRKKAEVWHDNLYNVNPSTPEAMNDSVAFTLVGDGNARVVALPLT